MFQVTGRTTSAAFRFGLRQPRQPATGRRKGPSRTQRRRGRRQKPQSRARHPWCAQLPSAAHRGLSCALRLCFRSVHISLRTAPSF